MKMYWVIGLLLIVIGMYCIFNYQAFYPTALIGAGVEVAFGILMIIQSLKRKE